MSGRPRHEIYEYSFEGKYLGNYSSIAEARRKFYPEDIGTRPMFVKRVLNHEYEITPENTILFKERVYRDDIVFLVKIVHCKYCNYNKNVHSDKPVQVYNIKGELLAEFANITIAQLMMPHIPAGTVYSQVCTSKGVKRHSHAEENLIFKFREE